MAAQTVERAKDDERPLLGPRLGRSEAERGWVCRAYRRVREVQDDQEPGDRRDVGEAAHRLEEVGVHLRLATRAGGWGATTSKKSFPSIFGASRSAAAVSSS